MMRGIILQSYTNKLLDTIYCVLFYQSLVVPIAEAGLKQQKSLMSLMG